MNSLSDKLNLKVIFTYIVLVIITLVGLFVINYFHISYPLSVSNQATTGELAVVGQGKVDVVPNITTIDAGIIVNNAATTQEAQEKMNTINNKIIDALTKMGIDKKDIQTSQYSVNPNYTFGNGDNKISGYNGNASVTIKVRDANKVGQVIQSATNAGANDVHSQGFSVDDPSVYQDQAREKAIQDAKNQAKKLSQELGIRLGPITNMVESSGNNPMPVTFNSMAPEAGALQKTIAPDIQQGTQTVNSTVTLYFQRY
jgi:uncharacterized protein YggE